MVIVLERSNGGFPCQKMSEAKWYFVDYSMGVMWCPSGDDYAGVDELGADTSWPKVQTWVLTHGQVDTCLRWANYLSMKKIKLIAYSSS